DSRFGERMRGTGVYQDLLRQRFTRQCRALGLNQAPQAPLRCDLFRRPGAEQLALF
ncbi:MAG: radical SAM protein, partial [Gammaproteobacteria bacterium]|nr:radical SAM protein [Gammaproteobacteria bacterium]